MINVRHYGNRLLPEPARVVLRPFYIAPEPANRTAAQASRQQRIASAVLAMTDGECMTELEFVNADFAARHWQTRAVYLQRFEHVASELGIDMTGMSETRRELLGAYFCHEYSYAAAAVMNPSIVPHVDQSNLHPGAQRFILSLRTVGEGHISSIAFREGILSKNGDLTLWPQPNFSIAAESDVPRPIDSVTARRPPSVPISGAVIFPFTPAQRNGLEDLRLVRFAEDDGEITYYGTYTAYSGAGIRSELLATKDFTTFELSPFAGDAARNKGMALFPHRIDGKYAMIGRQDNESLFFLLSDNLHAWNGGELIVKPRYAWELVQMGNCGAPIELDEGWLLLTHGVGAMRKYSIGAVLLDKRNPRKVLGRTAQPLLSPSAETREGYVPNVLYTCGGLKHGDKLFLPYALADSSISFAMMDLSEILKEMS
jgi:predicted GH43/DUF377 family glycosyl hydrolase